MGAIIEDEENEFCDSPSDGTRKESVTVAQLSPIPSVKMSPTDSSVSFSPELLGIYYSRLFPYHLLYSWLSYDASSIIPDSTSKGNVMLSSTSNNSLFCCREFSMTIEPTPGNEVYIRYLSFSSQAELSAAILKRRPIKIDIGAVYNYPPKDHKSLPSGKLQTQERELVFDIDLTDYDTVRNCGCEGAKICRRCWKFMGMAVEIMEEGLRKDFGFKHIAWFYSGRRGVHCWVCDKEARKMTNEARSAVASYFEVNLGSDKNRNFHLAQPLHPMLSRAFNLLEPHFISSVISEDGHGLLATQASWTKLLLTLPESANPVSYELEKKWSSHKDHSSPAEKWVELKAALMTFIGKAATAKVSKKITNTDRTYIEHWPIETVFKYTYPRLDINVSKQQNHLLKSPFCVHPKTGRVCVPIDVEKFDSFDPFKVPTLSQLIQQVDDYEQTDTVYDWEKTALKESFEMFQKKFLVPLMTDVRASQWDERERRAAMVGDF